MRRVGYAVVTLAELVTPPHLRFDELRAERGDVLAAERTRLYLERLVEVRLRARQRLELELGPAVVVPVDKKGQGLLLGIG